MKFQINNPSSPGASFTPNTNSVLLKTYEWITEHEGLVIPFREFRMKLQTDKGVNDNNNRNIYPLLKNGGLVSYERGGSILVDNFFTRTGLAYVKALQAKSLLNNQSYTKEKIKQASKKFDDILSEIIYGALLEIVKHTDVNYIEAFQDLVCFLCKFDKISKEEFALLIYSRTSKSINDSLSAIEDYVRQHRAGNLDFEISVQVRNDIDLREQTMQSKRQENLSFLTSYGYFIGLLQQAGLIQKSEKYHQVVESQRSRLIALGGQTNE